VLATLALLDFFDSREKAILIWAAAIIVFVAWKTESVGRSFLAVARAALHWKLVLLFGSAAVYSAMLLYLAWWVDLWHMAALKETLYWFAGSGLILIGSALTPATSGRDWFRRLLRQTFQFTLFLEFFVNLYVLPFLIELVLVPVVFFLVCIQVLPEYRAPRPLHFENSRSAH
jgi:hypothetical protein